MHDIKFYQLFYFLLVSFSLILTSFYLEIFREPVLRKILHSLLRFPTYFFKKEKNIIYDITNPFPNIFDLIFIWPLEGVLPWQVAFWLVV